VEQAMFWLFRQTTYHTQRNSIRICNRQLRSTNDLESIAQSQIVALRGHLRKLNIGWHGNGVGRNLDGGWKHSARQCDNDSRAETNITADVNGSSMSLHNSLSDRQAESDTTGLTASAEVRSIESSKNEWQMLFCDSASSIHHTANDGILLALTLDSD
jgi:hypothetical protein